ncbi:hypothetical protein K469DRAFT_644307 [Zopfia rhizophila CBS 207.26]|uniref:Membrane fusion mating protein FIG1 n=1 Tax=Zopfia rhizophila CBS 207.26 TaxID=1314779 RepID=A0A6A6DHR5_9PEZI|nr:hypothetical protein K469DRAFT_644307 [Zopfia rhizophila CBS 207.26]
MRMPLGHRGDTRYYAEFTSITRYLAYHHLIMITIIFAVIVSTILLVGCASTHIGHRVYLAQLSYIAITEIPNAQQGAWENITSIFLNAGRGTNLRVRVGYFGLCASQNGTSWSCHGSATSLITSRRFSDPLGIVSMAESVKGDVFFPGLLLGSAGLALISLLILSLFPNYHTETDELTGEEVEVKPFPSRKKCFMCLASTTLAVLFTFVSALWQHTSSATAATLLQFAAFPLIKASVGTIGTVLAWLAFGLWLVACSMTLLAIISYAVLDKLTDDDDSSSVSGI